MLQPMQPMGTPNQAATGPKLPGMPQQGGQRPQGQMPAGQMLSSVAPGGIASALDQIGNAYHGNPQALEQKGMGGDLLAALAAQRLKSRMEQAQREVQMQAAGQQAPQQQKTVVEQNEDALMELTKQEMQREQMDTLKQKQGQMQAGQQRLMQQAMAPQQQGISGLPAPNAAEPKAMAAGGIIAFDGGGSTTIDPVTGEPYTPSGSGLGALDPRQYLHASTDEERRRMNELLEKYKGKITAKQARDISEGRMTEDEFNRPMATTQPGAQPGTPRPDQQLEGGPQPEARKGEPPKNVADIRPQAPAQGIENVLGNAQKAALQVNPQAEAEKVRTSNYEFIKPSDEDIASRRQNLSGIQALNQKYFDPDRQQTRELIKTLAVGPSSFAASTMSNLGRNAVRASEDEYRQQRAALLGEDKQLGDIMSDIYAPKKEAAAAGTEGLKQATSVLTHGISAATQQHIAELQAAAQRDATAASREGLNFQRLTATLANVTDKREKARQKVMEGYAMNPDFALLNKDPAKLSSGEQKRIGDLKAKINDDMSIALKGFDNIINSVEAQLGYNKGIASPSGSTSGWGKVQQVGQ